MASEPERSDQLAAPVPHASPHAIARTNGNDGLIAAKRPWQISSGIEAVVETWRKSKTITPCFTANQRLPGRTLKDAAFPKHLAPALASMLQRRGIERLYAHQAAAFEAAAKAETGVKRAVVIATPTASGKSLCFHLPVLQALHDDPEARALYLYPTKALSRDQEAGLIAMMKDAGLPAAALVFDGDTPGDARRAAKDRGRVILTNPDMLHAGVLPHHAGWARLFSNLRYIVVDEMHTYRGVFGSHVANVLRRLLRVAAFHGSQPMLIGATATIGNPCEHASELFGITPEQIELLTESGAPSGDRQFFSFNPPVVNAELGIRASYIKQAVMLGADLARAKVPSIIFAQSRNNVEVMLRYLREAVRDDVPKDAILGYRGGYLPHERREIERRLREGDVLCVIATNALELGIDIGELDAVVCAGYPGSISSLWQRFGRAGRRKGLSIAVLVTSSAPLDQFLANQPEYLLGAPVEEARIDPANVEILLQHLKCAAFELPFANAESFGAMDEDETRSALSHLAHHGILHENRGAFHWATDAYPANHVSLRSVGWDNVVIIDVETDKSIAEVDFRGAQTMVHEQAIYQHDGETFQVERFDHENHKAFVRKVKPDYFTDAMTYVHVNVLEETGTATLAHRSVNKTDDDSEPRTEIVLAPAAKALPATPSAGWGDVSIIEKVVGYKKVKFFTHENAGYGEVRLPEIELVTTAFWLTLPDAFCETLGEPQATVVDGLRGVGVALETAACFSLMCDPRDLGSTIGGSGSKEDGPPRSMRTGEPIANPTLFLYEHTPSGLGLANRIFDNHATLLGRAERLIANCPCARGCPACVGPVQDEKRKSVAADILRHLL
jgi:DEAD/DEAH box helicase domain-containing protein